MKNIEELKIGNSEIEYGIKIVFNDKRMFPDFIDPVVDGGLTENDTQYLIDNGFNVYPYEKNEVSDIIRYKLCQVCHYPIDNCHCEDEIT